MFKFFTRIFLSRPCFSCGRRPQEPWFLLCPSCAQGIPFLQPEGRCPRCLNLKDSKGNCSNCAQREIFWDNCTALLDYRQEIPKRLFLLYKFEGSLAAEKDLRTFLAPQLKSFAAGNRIILAPSSKRTVITLGFSPMERLLSSFFMCETPFTRIGNIAQKDLSAEDRRRKGFLALREGFNPPKNLWLGDDVMTTGSTLNEAARLLKERGAQSINVLTLFRD